jgi:hypothetical protein
MKDESSFGGFRQWIVCPTLRFPLKKNLMQQSGNRMSSMNFR